MPKRLRTAAQVAAEQRWYQANKDVVKAKKLRKRLRLREIIREAKDVPCADCGGRFPSYVMDFDHREDKLVIVSKLPEFGSVAKLLGEIAKCDVVCANCHRERTFGRGAQSHGTSG
jgi:hypothetical protein